MNVRGDKFNRWEGLSDHRLRSIARCSLDHNRQPTTRAFDRPGCKQTTALPAHWAADVKPSPIQDSVDCEDMFLQVLKVRRRLTDMDGGVHCGGSTDRKLLGECSPKLVHLRERFQLFFIIRERSDQVTILSSSV